MLQCNKYYNDFLNYMQINDKEFKEVIDRSRPDHLWEKIGNEFD